MKNQLLATSALVPIGVALPATADPRDRREDRIDRWEDLHVHIVHG